jgi:hypothetical protein
VLVFFKKGWLTAKQIGQSAGEEASLWWWYGRPRMEIKKSMIRQVDQILVVFRGFCFEGNKGTMAIGIESIINSIILFLLYHFQKVNKFQVKPSCPVSSRA